MTYTIEACEDCYMAGHGLPVPPGSEPTPEPLNLISDGERVGPGCTECDPCGHDDCHPRTVTCQCPHGDPGHGFSWSPCQGCGSPLGGNRYPLEVGE